MPLSLYRSFPSFSMKRTEKTPRTTTLNFTFPDGQEVNCESENVILEELTKEYIIEKRLFPYIPFYIARYEKDIVAENSIEGAVKDREYFRNEMLRLHGAGELSDDELIDLKGFVNTIITHITNGNGYEERLVNVMGGTVIETESERLRREGREGERCELVKRMLYKGKTPEEISEICDYDLSYVRQIEERMLEMV